jgi:hypothetical protein
VGGLVIIVHRCTQCRHPDIYHGIGDCCYSWCKCKDPVFGSSEIIPTFAPGGAEVAETVAPGTRTPEFGTLCNCEQCWNTYNLQTPST